jgi:hypothetical protein
MRIVATSAFGVPADRSYRLWPFFVQEYLRIMRSSVALLIWAVLLYTLAALPFLMAKPSPELFHFIARQYMLARLTPIMLMLTALGAISALVHGLALVAAGLDYPWLPYLGASAVVVAWTVCLVGIVNLAILSARETYTAALIAFIPIAVAILPGSIYMYRSDLFDGVPLFRAIFVFPMTLLWHPDFSARWGLALASLLFGVTIALIAASGRRIEAWDIG